MDSKVLLGLKQLTSDKEQSVSLFPYMSFFWIKNPCEVCLQIFYNFFLHLSKFFRFSRRVFESGAL